MTNIQTILANVQKELETQHFGVLTTIRNDTPHSTLVCFSVTPDLRQIFFFTPRHNRKYVNMNLYEKVSFFIDTTTNSPRDIQDAMTIAANGTIFLENTLTPTQLDEYKHIYLKKNPHMSFFLQKSVILAGIDVERYEVVMQFQTVADVLVKENFSLIYRQLQGTSLKTGFVRGKLIHWTETTSVADLSPQQILYIPQKLTPDLITQLNNLKIGGLILKDHPTTDLDIPCPIVSGIELSPRTMTSSADISLNGDLGIVTFHMIKE